MKSLNPNVEKSPSLKRFLAFYGYIHYPNGGWDDFLKDFDSLEDAKNALIKEEAANKTSSILWVSSWGQIFDTKTKQIVWADS